jgi:methylglutaconyl-CoA hydratase
MSYSTLETTLQQGVAVIWLNRPEVRNAMNAALIGELTDAVARASEDDAVRAIVLAGRGKAFCAGADLNGMRAAAVADRAENEADATRLAALLRTIAESSKPTVARVHGPAFAGGLGLVAACDIAVAAAGASFCLTEVKIGLIPATISPYVIRAMGARMASRYWLTAEVFDGAEAYRHGLVQEIAQDEELDGAVNALLGRLLQGGPGALAATTALIRDVENRPIDDALVADTARRIAAARASDEGREGIAAFLDKRAPNWHPQR